MLLHEYARAAIAASGNADLRFAEALEVLEGYDGARANAKPVHGSVSDSAGLPYPKDTIKWALLLLLGAVDPAGREPLKAAFIALADWQSAEEVESGSFDSMRLRRKLDPLALAQELAARATSADRWLAASRDEQSRLIAELRQRGFW